MSGYNRYRDTDGDAACGPLRVFIAVMRIPFTIMSAAGITVLEVMCAVLFAMCFALCLPFFLLQVLSIPFSFVICTFGDAHKYAKWTVESGIMAFLFLLFSPWLSNRGVAWSWLAKFSSAHPESGCVVD